MESFQYELGSSGNIAVGAASVSATIPAGTEYLALSTAGNCHFRTGIGSATAVAGDPLLTNAHGIIIYRVPSGHTKIAVIQDGASTGNFNFAKVAWS